MTSADLDDLSLAESLLPFALHFAQDPFGAFPRPFSRESRRCVAAGADLWAVVKLR